MIRNHTHRKEQEKKKQENPDLDTVSVHLPSFKCKGTAAPQSYFYPGICTINAAGHRKGGRSPPFSGEYSGIS